MRLILTALLLSLAAARCTVLPQETVVHDPAAIRDAYLIAHGMAKGYAERQDADPKVLAQLRTLDLHAAEAVGNLVESGAGQADTARAVAALSNYAAQQTPLPQ